MARALLALVAVCAGIAASAVVLPLETLAPVVWLFGPPAVVLAERHGAEGADTFQHADLDALLAAHVDARGRVDYAALAQAPAGLDAYLARLATAPWASLSRDAKLALLINAYNAFTLRLILDHYPLDSIKDIAAADRWKAARWILAGETLSLDALEHERLRAHFREPRVHFALVCASVGCPPLRAEAYTAARLEGQLDAQARRVLAKDSEWLQVSGERVALTPIFLWYSGDFEQVAGSVEAYARRYVELPDDAAMGWGRYDWSLNGQ